MRPSTRLWHSCNRGNCSTEGSHNRGTTVAQVAPVAISTGYTWNRSSGLTAEYTDCSIPCLTSRLSDIPWIWSSTHISCTPQSKGCRALSASCCEVVCKPHFNTNSYHSMFIIERQQYTGGLMSCGFPSNNSEVECILVTLQPQCTTGN